jgi:hypothetical protein
MPAFIIDLNSGKILELEDIISVVDVFLNKLLTGEYPSLFVKDPLIYADENTIESEQWKEGRCAFFELGYFPDNDAELEDSFMAFINELHDYQSYSNEHFFFFFFFSSDYFCYALSDNYLSIIKNEARRFGHTSYSYIMIKTEYLCVQ